MKRGGSWLRDKIGNKHQYAKSCQASYHVAKTLGVCNLSMEKWGTLQISASSQESYRSYRLLGWLKPDLYTYISNLCRDSKQKNLKVANSNTSQATILVVSPHLHPSSILLPHPSVVDQGWRASPVSQVVSSPAPAPWLRVATPLWHVAQLFGALRRSNSARSAPPGPRSPSNENAPLRGDAEIPNF